jgi:hypothetical protein
MRARSLVLAAFAVFAPIAPFAAASCGLVVVDGEPGASSTGGGDCGDDGLPVPAALRACASDAECTIQFVDIDCCGTQAVVGVATALTASLRAYEARCNPFQPTCSCAPGPALTDDGQRTMADASSIRVACLGGRCSTRAP